MPIDIKQFQDQAKSRVYDEVDERQYFFILTNGKVTEKVYFERFKHKLHKGMVLNVEFKNKSPDGLSKFAERRLRNQSIVYDEIWVVFDKDDFDCFEDTVKKLSNGNKFSVAFSNECFEIWLLLHFCDINEALNRVKCLSLFKEQINLHSIKKKYSQSSQLKKQANINDILDVVEKSGCREDAINRVTTWQNNMDDIEFCKVNPSTTVYKLVDKLDKAIQNYQE
ncbi:MAG: RloB family protein [Kiritimatiellae bacterium]|jgi:hypothetical protein|nr:RloB family protein [Kiritimatiellia bacterium]